MSGATSLFFRGFFLEALFNPRGKQRGGLAWILRHGDDPISEEPFNANPVLAGYVVGWIQTEGKENYRRNRASLASALGGVGDRLIWGLLRPLAVVAALIATIGGPIAAAAALLLVYNPAEIYLRWRSLRQGLKGQAAVLRDLSRDGLLAYAPRLARLFALLIGALGGSWLAGHLASGRYLEGGAGAVAAVLGWLLLRRRTFGFWRLPLTVFILGIAWFAVEIARISAQGGR
jgi:hypothetical protein